MKTFYRVVSLDKIPVKRYHREEEILEE